MAKFQAPTDAQVEEVLRKIPSPQLRRAFFEGLKNPLWVTPLARKGAFSSPPEPQVMEDGLVRDVYWPEIDYLIRVAPEAPASVVDVLLKLSKSNNPWVRRGVFTVGSIIPADQAARLQPLIKSWISSGFGWRTDPRETVDLTVNLLQGGQYEVGRWLANLLFRPSVTSTSNEGKPTLVLEDYWYENGLPRVVTVLGDDGLSVVSPWLETYERSKGYFKQDSDITFMSRDSVRTRSDSHDGVEQSLIDAVRDLAIHAMHIDPTAAKALLVATKMILMRKIALFALAEAITQSADDDEQMNAMLRVAIELLFDKSSLDNACRIEYAELARAAVSRSAKALDPLPGFIESGLRIDNDRLRKWLSGQEANGSAIDERVDEYNRRRMHRWLSAIGVDALPEQLRATLAELDEHFGVIESPLEPGRSITSWSGPNSPITQDDMSVMSPAELVAHLESWHDMGNGWGPEPSHEGQGRALTALLTTNPKAVAGIDNLPDRLRPTYLRAILHGWEAAVKSDLELDWAQVASLIRGILTHDDESTFPVEGGRFDDDANFRPAKQAAVGLLEELVGERAALIVPDEAMSQFAEMLITLADDETAWSEYISYDKESGMDPLTVSLNWQWPIRVRGLIYLMSRGKDTSWYEAARSSLERELARADTRGASRAVLGEGLARLLLTDPEWVESNISTWFGDEDGVAINQQISLTTAIAVHHYHPKLYDLLAPAMLSAIKSKDSIVAGWRMQFDPLQRIGEWIVSAIIQGHKSLEDPVVMAFFSSATAEVRGEAIGRIAWSFLHAEVVDEAIRDRFADLWDMRVEHVRSHPNDHEELNGFEWFVKSKKFSVEWWLPRLKEAAELNSSFGSKTRMISKEIASAADVDPRIALDVLKLLLQERNDADIAGYALRRDAIPIVLAKAIASGDSELQRDALRFMNHLGEQGDLGLEAAVRAVLAGRITQTGVDE